MNSLARAAAFCITLSLHFLSAPEVFAKTESEDNKMEDTLHMPREDALQQADHLLRELNAYFEDAPLADLERWRQIPPQLESWGTVLRGVHDQLMAPRPPPQILQRSSPILDLVAEKVERRRQSTTLELRMAYHQLLEPILRRYSMTHEVLLPVLRIYDSLQLWSGDEFWYVNQTLRLSQDIEDHWHRVHWMIPYLDVTQRRELANTLRRFTPQQLTALYLLYETDQLTPVELSTLLRLTSDNFLRTLALRAWADDDTLLLGRTRDERQTLYSHSLYRIMRALEIGDALTTSAFNRAIAMATWSSRRGGDKNKLLFFQMLSQGTLNWIDHRQWLTSDYKPMRGHLRLVPPSPPQGQVIGMKEARERLRECTQALEAEDKTFH